MRESTTSTPSLAGRALAAVFTILIVSLVALAAEQGPPGGPPAPLPPGTPPKPLVPVAASSVAANPDAYVGEYVTLSGAVETNLSRSAFSVDQDKTKTTGKEVLVLAPTLLSAAEPNTYVTVIGQLVKFDVADIAAKLKGYTLDLSPEAIERFKGRPVVLATAVINKAGIDIAKKPIPPPTADDLMLAKVMTRLPPAQAALRKAIEGSAVDLTKEQAGVIKQAFTETEAFWKTKGNTEAMQWAADARKLSDAILIASAAGKWDEVKAAATPLGQTCGTCHTKYRERMEDGTFRIKAGVK